MVSNEQRKRMLSERIGHFATADKSGVPHVIPVCFALGESSAYVVIDKKPKQTSPRRLKRVRNILENPKASLLVDHYAQDWERVDWVRADGPAELLTEGDEREQALGLLRERYSQYREMDLEDAPVIALRIEHVSAQ